ncbi:sulfate ABC transporter substrate-binding protein [Cohnella yongneupensis]|uniref:Sulfate ABC transporter substrate-binding protein n=1 Tax=Cohnella yongneupensis TaxID=425006 RepID=A0ABW0R1L7_9BACL
MYQRLREIRARSIFAGLLTFTVLTVTACSGGNDSKSAGGEEASPTSDYTKPVHLVNAVSDGTAELFKAIDGAFVPYWKERTGQSAEVEQSAGNSSAQETAVIDGTIQADLVTLGVGIDIDAIQAKGKIGEGWQQRYDYNSSPFETAVAFVVRTGNPKAIAEWDDLVQSDAQVVVANPATYSDARWYYAAPWAVSLDQSPEDQEAAKAYVTSFHERVAVLAQDDASAETAFLNDNKGDVWVTTESNALRVSNAEGKGKVDVVVPSVTLAVEPIVSVVDANADAKGAREAANGYADFLFTEQAQTLAAQHFYRPRFASVTEQFAEQFSEITLLTVDDNLTGWEDLQSALFADGGLYGQLPAK